LTTRLDTFFVSIKYFTKSNKHITATFINSDIIHTMSQSKSLNAMTLLVLATTMLFSMLFSSSSGGFLIKGVEGRKLSQAKIFSKSKI